MEQWVQASAALEISAGMLGMLFNGLPASVGSIKMNVWMPCRPWMVRTTLPVSPQTLAPGVKAEWIEGGVVANMKLI